MKKLYFILAMALVSLSLNAQVNENGELQKYKRSSLYSVLISHSDLKFSDQISEAFRSVPIPDKFNDHNLEIREIESTSGKVRQQGKEKDKDNTNDANIFISSKNVPRDLVAKWFNRDSKTGGFDMSLVQERGFYDASKVDISAAEMSGRGLAMLGDAGEDRSEGRFSYCHYFQGAQRCQPDLPRLSYPRGYHQKIIKRLTLSAAR